MSAGFLGATTADATFVVRVRVVGAGAFVDVTAFLFVPTVVDVDCETEVAGLEVNFDSKLKVLLEGAAILVGGLRRPEGAGMAF